MILGTLQTAYVLVVMVQVSPLSLTAHICACNGHTDTKIAILADLGVNTTVPWCEMGMRRCVKAGSQALMHPLSGYSRNIEGCHRKISNGEALSALRARGLL